MVGFLLFTSKSIFFLLFNLFSILCILLKRKIESITFFSLLFLFLQSPSSSTSYYILTLKNRKTLNFLFKLKTVQHLEAHQSKYKDLDNSIMNISSWKDANDDVSGETTSRHRGEDGEEAVIVATTSGKTVISKPPASVSSSSSSWMKSKDPRIVRVSRAFGGKDRHSKVCTLRGLRDRRVRLSVPTAIQLYDLQERLGVDQPSKAVDWLLDAAKDDIDELPPLPISPETFTLFNHNQPFLNLGQRVGQDPSQLGVRINECVQESTSREENNKGREENDAVFANNHHIGSYGTNMEQQHHHHHQHSNFQAEYYHHHHHHQLHSLVPYPSQILVCPMTTTTTTTIQSFFPSSSSAGSVGTMETVDPRQMVSHYQMPLMGTSSSSSSQNISTLYSLLHGSSSTSGGTGLTANMSRFHGSESSPSRGRSDGQM